MGWPHVLGNRIALRQVKTERPLTIPVHPDLKRALALLPQSNMTTFLVTEHGAAFTAAGFGNWFRDLCNEAGLPECSAHGLRHAAAPRLANAGCSEHEIGSTLGLSLAMVGRYTAAASQEQLADRALSRQLRSEHEQKSTHQSDPRLPNRRYNVESAK